VSKSRGARNEKEEQRRQLEAVGWELVERGGGITIWHNLQNGCLYPQFVATTMGGPEPRIVDESPGQAGREHGGGVRI